MGFFEGFGPPELPDEPDHEQPDWFGPPKGWLGGVVPIELLLSRNDDVAVFIRGLIAYPSGVQLTFSTLARSREVAPQRALLPATTAEPEDLRYGIEFPDGRRASSQGAWLGGGSATSFGFAGEGEGPDPERDLIFEPRGGGGGELDSHQDYWVWPLPPPGPVRFLCEWEKGGLPESAVELEAEVLQGAADRAQEVWKSGSGS